MRKVLALALMLGLINAPLLQGAATFAAYPAVPAASQEDYGYQSYSPEQLDNLLAPIALYPDPLLAQVLLAATFADQIDEAARYVRSYGQAGIDDQPWDVSVKAVAHYPSVLNMMADKLDWTTALGQAYAYQSTDVMTSVQHLRAMARSQGNLITTPQQEVVVQDGYIEIWPAQPDYLYVPWYDANIVYYQPWPGWGPYFVGFSVGFFIGVWLNHGCDWRHHRVYYTGWRGGGWIERSRPRIRMDDRYVNDRYNNVFVNRDVARRNLNYYNLNRYNSVHRDTKFDDHVRDKDHYKPDARANNKIIDRNINSGDPRLDRYRGHQQRPPERGPAAPPVNRPTAPVQARPQPPARPAEPPVNRPTAPVQARPQPHGFGRGEGNFDPSAASQRGQSSRSEARQPARSAPPSPPSAPRSAPPSRPSAPPSSSAPQGHPTGRSR